MLKRCLVSNWFEHRWRRQYQEMRLGFDETLKSDENERSKNLTHDNIIGSCCKTFVNKRPVDRSAQPSCMVFFYWKTMETIHFLGPENKFKIKKFSCDGLIKTLTFVNSTENVSEFTTKIWITHVLYSSDDFLLFLAVSICI